MDSTWWCIIVPLVTIGAIFAIVKSQLDRQNAAKAAYHAVLERLRNDPTNADLRQETLSLGRAYSRFTRTKYGVMFDEAALMNDINAATGGSYTVVGTSGSLPAHVNAAPSAVAQLPLQERLHRLDDLRAAGTLTDDEYQERRKKILDEL
jgi:hypothetical protein